jgi:hypothetical protein
MSALMPCDFLGALRQRSRDEDRDDAEQALKERVYRDERNAFLVACGDCALKLPASGDTVWHRVFDDLLALNNDVNWKARRELFDVLLASDSGRKWLADRATEHARDESDSASLDE